VHAVHTGLTAPADLLQHRFPESAPIDMNRSRTGPPILPAYALRHTVLSMQSRKRHSQIRVGLALLTPLLLSAACSRQEDSAVVSPATTVVVPATPAMPYEYRNPIQERSNALNEEPVVANEGRFPELEKLRSEYLIPESAEVARTNVRAAARAFGAAVLYSIREPRVSGLNLYLPNHPNHVTLPAGLNAIGRASLHGRDAVSGVDVGPSVPDENGRVWVAVFMGASGPIGAVESYCVGVTLDSNGVTVEVAIEEIASRVVRQPLDRSDFVEVECQLDLEARLDDGFAPGV
jgi:hypothetical protein